MAIEFTITALELDVFGFLLVPVLDTASCVPLCQGGPYLNGMQFKDPLALSSSPAFIRFFVDSLHCIPYLGGEVVKIRIG